MKPCTGYYEQPQVSNEWHLARGCQELKLWAWSNRQISRALCSLILTLNTALTCSILLLWSVFFFYMTIKSRTKMWLGLWNKNHQKQHAISQLIFVPSWCTYVCLSMFSVGDLCFPCLLDGNDALIWKYLYSLFLIAFRLYTRVLNRNVRHRAYVGNCVYSRNYWQASKLREWALSYYWLSPRREMIWGIVRQKLAQGTY
jgi:hypothetical protein